MPLPLTISCFSKIQIGFTFLVPAHPGSPGKRAVKWVRMCLFVRHIFFLTPNQQYQSTDGMNVLITLMLTSVQSNLTIDIVVLLSVTKSKSLLIDGIPWAHTSLPFPPKKVGFRSVIRFCTTHRPRFSRHLYQQAASSTSCWRWNPTTNG